MVLQPGQFRENQTQVFRALRHFDPRELLDTERVGPVVGHRTKIIEPVRVRHRAEVTGVLANFFVVPMQVTEDRFEFAHHFAIERDVHPEDAMGGGMLRPHRNFHQVAFDPRIHRLRRSFFELVKSRCAHCCAAVRFSVPSNCGRGG